MANQLSEMMERCRPLKVGVVLIMGMMLAMTLQINKLGGSLYGLLSLYAASALTIMMMFSFCENGQMTSAWVAVLLAPFVIGLFAFQVQSIFGGVVA